MTNEPILVANNKNEPLWLFFAHQLQCDKCKLSENVIFQRPIHKALRVKLFEGVNIGERFSHQKPPNNFTIRFDFKENVFNSHLNAK